MKVKEAHGIMERRLTIGKAAQAAGLTRKAVRVYEARGLLPSTQRSDSGYRLYDHHDIEVLTFIRRARSLGLRLDDIRDVLAIHAGGRPPCATVRALLGDRMRHHRGRVAGPPHARDALIFSGVRGVVWPGGRGREMIWAWMLSSLLS